MSIRPLDLTGGKSVFCFNESQFRQAQELAEGDDESGRRIRAEMDQLEETFSRNERAALAFMLIDRLSRSSEH